MRRGYIFAVVILAVLATLVLVGCPKKAPEPQMPPMGPPPGEMNMMPGGGPPPAEPAVAPPVENMEPAMNAEPMGEPAVGGAKDKAAGEKGKEGKKGKGKGKKDVTIPAPGGPK